jgi:Rieske Fe-S protein
MADSRQPRRKFLKIATAAIGGAIGAFVAVPILRYVLFPIGRRVVAEAGGAVDVIGVDALEPGAAPIRVELTARSVRDAWTVASDVPLGAAWLRKDETGQVVALSSACPHLGCAIDFNPDDSTYRCPCHKSAFAVSGDKISGPSKRGLDPLPVAVESGRVKVEFKRFRPDVPEREEV